MEKVKDIEVRGCKDSLDGSVHWTTEEDAEFFGVYGGGPGNYGWLADFADMNEALNWANLRAMRLGARLHNRIGEV